MTLEVIFVTGTGTDVGKTYIASRLAETRRASGSRVGVYKPVASGCAPGKDGERIASDAVELWESAGRPLSLHKVCPQRFEKPVAPPEAAAAEGKTVDEGLLIDGVQPWLDTSLDVLLIEGAGGLFSPISESMLNIDFALAMRDRLPQLQVVMIAPNRLGVIHDCIASVRAASVAGLQITSIQLNSIGQPDASSETNAASIEQWTGVRVLSL